MLIALHRIAVIDRARVDFGDLDALAEDIKRVGQVQSGVVRSVTDEDVAKHGIDPVATPFVLVAGGRRYAACYKAGLEFFKADDWREMTPLQQKDVELSENLNRKDFTWDEEVKLRKELMDLRTAQAAEKGETYTQRDLAKELGQTPANISRDLKLAKALEDPKIAAELKAAPTQASAVRILEFKQKVAERTAAVSGNKMHSVSQRLVTADMRQYVRTLATDSVNLCFTDFPFGIDYDFEGRERNAYADSVGALKDLLTDMIPQIFRVTKPNGWLALMMGSTNYGYLADLCRTCCTKHYEYDETWWQQSDSGEWKWRRKFQCSKGSEADPCTFVAPEDPEWLWYRPNSRNPSKWPEYHAANEYEKICVVNMGQAVLINKNLGNVLNHDAVYEDRIHEMQRPHSLCLDVVSRFTVGGECVLDLCFGSGSALAAAAELQREYRGCDINPKNLEPALMWVAEHAK